MSYNTEWVQELVEAVHAWTEERGTRNLDPAEEELLEVFRKEFEAEDYDDDDEVVVIRGKARSDFADFDEYE